MLGNKVSQFIKKRYLVTPEGEEYVMDRDASQGLVRDEKPIEPVDPEPVIEPPVVEVAEVDQEMLDYEKSNHGRSYGWWICLDGQRVATLEYRCLLEEPVHLYTVNVLDDKFLRIDLDPQKWLQPNVTFQSRYAGNYIKQGLSMAAVGQKMIVVEDLFIPETHFRKQHHEIEAFHQMLLEKAKGKSNG